MIQTDVYIAYKCCNTSFSILLLLSDIVYTQSGDVCASMWRIGRWTTTTIYWFFAEKTCRCCCCVLLSLIFSPWAAAAVEVASPRSS